MAPDPVGVTDSSWKCMIDANINRLREGLRVIEDYCRFVMHDEEFTGRLRDIRHSVNSISERIAPAVIGSRAVSEDCLAEVMEQPRLKGADVVAANFNRAKEALRVLEESMKIFDRTVSYEYKLKRFALYSIEQDILGALVPEEDE